MDYPWLDSERKAQHLKDRKKILHEVKQGYVSPGDLDQHDKALKEHEHPYWDKK